MRASTRALHRSLFLFSALSHAAGQWRLYKVVAAQEELAGEKRPFLVFLELKVIPNS
jgi:hypothetical protein